MDQNDQAWNLDREKNEYLFDFIQFRVISLRLSKGKNSSLGEVWFDPKKKELLKILSLIDVVSRRGSELFLRNELGAFNFSS